jgi:hypothetical protein
MWEEGREKDARTVYNISSESIGQKKRWLKLLNFGCYLLQNSLLGNLYSDPIVSSTLQKHSGSHFPYCCRVPLAIPFGCQTLFQNVVPPFQFQFGKQSKIAGG